MEQSRVFADRIYCGADSAESPGGLWHVRQRVFAAKAAGVPPRRFFPLWQCAQPPLSWGTSIPTGPLETRSNGTGWQSLQESFAVFEAVSEPAPRCRTCENATGSMRFKTMRISVAGIGLSGNSAPMRQPGQMMANAKNSRLRASLMNFIACYLVVGVAPCTFSICFFAPSRASIRACPTSRNLPTRTV